MQCGTVGSSQVDMMSAWTINILQSFIENILPTKYLHGRNQCQVQFMSLFFTSTKLGYEMYLNRLKS